METGTDLSQLKSELIKAEGTGKIFHAAGALQRAVQGGDEDSLDFPYPSAFEVAGWGGLGLSRELIAKSHASLIGTPYEGWQISFDRFSPPLTYCDRTEGLIVRLQHESITRDIPLNELHAPFAERAASWMKNEVGPPPVSLACVLVKGWWERPKSAEPSFRDDGILPKEFAAVRDISAARENVGPDADPIPVQGNLLEGIALPPPRSPLTGALPEFEMRRGVSPIFPLMLFDCSPEMLIKSRGGTGAPLPLRLWIEILLSVPLAERTTIRTTEMDISLRKLVRMLWPRGWGGPKRDGEKLMRAIDMLDHAWIQWTGPDGKPGGYRRHVAVFNRPSMRNPNSKLDVCVRMPPGTSGTGPMVHRPSLRLFGTRSVAGYRLLLSAYYFWNQHLTHRGKPFRSVVPQVRRNSDQVILDVDGRPVTNKTGRPVYHWNHSKAVRIPDVSDVRNPVIAQRLPDLTAVDLLVMGAPYGILTVTKQARANALDDVLTAALKIHEEGLFLFDELVPRQRYRIEPPDWWAAPFDG